MDAYEATRVVFSRIQSLDPENAAKIMGLLLIQDHGEKEMIRLAFVPEPQLRSVVLNARQDLGLLPPSSPATAAPTTPPFLLGRQNSFSRLGASSPTSWAPPPVFSRSNSIVNGSGTVDDFDSSEEPTAAASPLYGAHGGDDLIDEFQLQDQLSFLNDGGGASNSAGHGLQMGPKSGELFYQDVAADCRSPSGGVEGVGMFPYSVSGWPATAAGHHRRSCSAAANLYLGTADAAAGLGWKPCLYFARGFCKNGTSCRFLHGLPDDTIVAAMAAAGGKLDAADAVMQQQCQELLLRCKSPRQLMASAFPYSPTGSLPASPSGGNKFMNFLLQHQNESQTVAAAAAAASLMLGGVEDGQRFIGRARMMERSDFAAVMVNPGSRQIYLTFPADSTFKEEDVSNYFSIYGPVQDVRIPYQQKRMFGFVTFVYPETVKLILAKGNPHFVCDARVLVKPYKEKGKVPDKYRKQQYSQGERGEFCSSATLTGFDSRDPFELPHLGTRMLYQEALLKRRLEEQQQAAELQRAIELQGRRFIGLQLVDVKTKSQFSSNAEGTGTGTGTSPTVTIAPPPEQEKSNGKEDKDPNAATVAATATAAAATVMAAAKIATVVAAVEKEESPKEDISFQESFEHNLPDNPFASPTKAAASSFMGASFSSPLPTEESSVMAASDHSNNGDHFIDSSPSPVTSPLRICFLQPMLLPNS